VFSKRRRRQTDRAPLTIDAHRVAHRVVRADPGMPHRLDERARGGGAKRLAYAADERRRNGRAPATSHPLRRGPLAELFLQNRHEHSAMSHPLRIRVETFVTRKLRQSQHALA